MSPPRLKYLLRVVRRGRAYWYFRRGGKLTKLPDPADAAKFYAAYSAALEGAQPAPSAPKLKPYSWDQVAHEWRRSAEWTALKPASRNTYATKLRGLLDWRLRNGSRLGDADIRDAEPRHIRALRDRWADRPWTCNGRLTLIRMMCNFAVERGVILSNPARDVRPIKNRSDGHHSWTDAEILQFEARWPIGTRERLAFDLLLYTAQRRKDVVAMGWPNVRGDQIEVRQSKSDKRLLIPIHPDLAQSLETVPRDRLLFIVTARGGAADPDLVSAMFRKATKAAGLPPGRVPHGLRKATARKLAEAGCSAHQIQALTGHESLSEVQRYTQAASQSRMARDVISLLGRNKTKTEK